MINSEMEIEKLEVWNGPSRPPYSYVWDGIERVRILPYTLTFFFFFPCRIFLSVDRSHLR